ncbi:hypothetical protein MXB_1974, partial [Myxobolus squamalis]
MDLSKTDSLHSLSKIKDCWVCQSSENDDSLGPENEYGRWISPCLCSGTCKYVHHECLSEYIDQKWSENGIGAVRCPICLSEYNVSFGNNPYFVYFALNCKKKLNSLQSYILFISCCELGVELIRIYSDSTLNFVTLLIVFSFNTVVMNATLTPMARYLIFPLVVSLFGYLKFN